MKQMISVFLALGILLLLSAPVFAVWSTIEEETALASAPVFTAEGDARACILMDAKTGKVLFEKNADEALPPASVTKVMTMLLVFEAIDAGLLS